MDLTEGQEQKKSMGPPGSCKSVTAMVDDIIHWIASRKTKWSPLNAWSMCVVLFFLFKIWTTNRWFWWEEEKTLKAEWGKIIGWK